MEPADWQPSAVLLTGLSLDMDPSKAHLALEAGLIQPFPDNMITSQLRMMGVRIFCHEKLMPFYQNQSTSQHVLAYFMCASYRHPESPPKKGQKNPRLRDSRPLPLAEWDNLYYALVAEVRKFYQDLQFHYGENFEMGQTILHDHGPNGAVSGQSKWSVVSMAGLLEEFWRALMDYRLVARLDKAVRLHQARIAATIHESDDSVNDQTSEAKIAPPQGLIDVNKRTPEELVDLVWAKHEAEKEANRKSGSSSIEESTFLALARAEVRGAASSRTPANRSMKCECPRNCVCRMNCSFVHNNCACKIQRNEVTDIVHEQYSTDTMARTLPYEGKGKGREADHHLFGAVTNEFAQMQVAAAAAPGPQAVEACRTNNTAAMKYDTDVQQHRRRQRAGTQNSNLAYVPPLFAPLNTTPSRSKEIFPLGFYGDNSGQRYPPFRGDITKVPPPFYGAAVPSRKPVPPQGARGHQSSSTVQNANEITQSSPVNNHYASQACLPQHQNINYDGSFSPNEHSSQIRSHGGKKKAARNLDTSVRATEYQQMATETENEYQPFQYSPQGFVATPDNNPSSNRIMHYRGSSEYTLSPTSTAVDSANQPQLRSFTQEPIRKAPAEYTLKLHEQIKEAISEDEELYSPQRSFFAPKPKKTTPKTDLPDFIAPRPATMQRYVSAGGTERLSERQAITVPFAEQAKEAAARGKSMPKEELMRILSDPNFMRDNFGEPCVERKPAKERRSATNKHGSATRKSGERSSGEDALQRRSDESEQDDVDAHGEKRGRTTSGASLGSGRFEKLRKVFTGSSRKNSISE